MSLKDRHRCVEANEPAEFAVTPEEDFLRRVYSSLDETIARLLDRLRREEGVTPSCRPGCSHCCRQYILTNSAEAHTLAQYIRRQMSGEQIRELRERTRRWHEWDSTRPGRYPQADPGKHEDFSDYEHCCPLLVNGACSAYSVRPVVCRTHFVRSHPLFCHAANDPLSTEEAPVALTFLVAATGSFSRTIRDHIEKTGVDFDRSIMLLPHWLSTEMGWGFLEECSK